MKLKIYLLSIVLFVVGLSTIVFVTNNNELEASGTDLQMSAMWMENISYDDLNGAEKIIFTNTENDELVQNTDIDYSTRDGIIDFNDDLEYYFVSENGGIDNVLVIHNDLGGRVITPPSIADYMFSPFGSITFANLKEIHFNSVFSVTSTTTSLQYFFAGLNNLEYIDSFVGWDVSSVGSNMASMFEDLHKIKVLDLTPFTHSNAGGKNMFQNCYSLETLIMPNMQMSLANYNSMFTDIATTHGTVINLDISMLNTRGAASNVYDFFGANSIIDSVLAPDAFNSITLPTKMKYYWMNNGTEEQTLILNHNIPKGTKVYTKESLVRGDYLDDLEEHFNQLITDNTYSEENRKLLEEALQAAKDKVNSVYDTAEQGYMESFEKELQDGKDAMNAIPYLINLTFNNESDLFELQVIDKGDKATLPSSEPTKPGHVFEGWYFHDGIEFRLVNFENDVFNENTTITAVFSQCHTVEFFTDNGSFIEDQSVKKNDFATRPLTDPTKTGFEFDDWYTDDTFTTVFEFATTPITADTIIYAKWIVTQLTVIFKNGDDVYTTEQVNYNTTVAEPTEPTKIGFDFDNWYTDDTFTTVFEFTTLITADTIIYAKWTVTQLTVNFMDGTDLLFTEQVDYDTTVTEPTTDPIKDGYTFAGWVTTNGGTDAFDFTTVITATTNIYASWTVSTYNQEFINGSGSTLMSNNLLSHGSIYEVTVTLRTLVTLDSIIIIMNGITLEEGTDYTVNENVYTLTNGITGNIVVETKTTNLRDAAKEELEDFYDDIINKNPDLTEDQLNDLKDALEEALGNVENSETLEDLENSVETGKVEMDKVLAEKELEDYYEDLKDKYPNLDDETLGELEDALNEALDKVENATTNDDLDTEVEAGKDAMDNVILEDAKDDAKEELEDYYEDLLEKYPDLDDETLGELEDALNDALDKVEDALTPEDALGEIQPGKDEMDKVIIEDELEDYYDDLIDKNPGLTDDQLEDLEDALEDALGNVNDSETTEDANDAAHDGKNEMDKIVSGNISFFNVLPLILTVIIMAICIYLASNIRKKQTD